MSQQAVHGVPSVHGYGAFFTILPGGKMLNDFDFDDEYTRIMEA